MNNRRTIYLFISTTMVFVYLLFYTILYRPSAVDAQAACFQLTLESRANAVPSCIGIPIGPFVTGYTSGPYGVPIQSILCKE